MCLWLVWLGVALPLPIAAAEKDDSAEIDALGARYSRNAEGAIVDVDLSNAWVTDADLGKLARLTQLESIKLAYTKVTDLGLEHLAPLQNVKVLDLYYAESVSDLGIAHLKQWKNLEYLNVRGTKVTSSLFEHLSKMTKLKFLDVGYTRVNDDLFETLESLDHLEHLAFGGNKMSGAALPFLKSLSALRELSVSGQQRTDSGLWSVCGNGFQHHPHRAARSTRSSRPGGDQRIRSRHRGAGAPEETAHAGPQGNPGDQQGDLGPDRPAEPAASQALESQGDR